MLYQLQKHKQSKSTYNRVEYSIYSKAPGLFKIAMEAEKTQQPVPIIAYAQGKMSKDETCGAFAVFIFKEGEPCRTIAWTTDATFQYRIEVDAVCVALEQVEPNGSITIHTRSKHVQIGLERLLEWKAKGWKIPPKEQGQAPRRVMNHDLWKRIDKVLTERTPQVNWVWELVPENRDKNCKNVHRHAKTLARKYAEERAAKRQSEDPKNSSVAPS